MISQRKNQGMIVLVLALIGSAAWAGEPKEAPISLKFEISPTPLGPYSAGHLPFGRANESGAISFAAAKPSYAADIVIAGPTQFLPFPRRATWDIFLRECAMQRAGLSESQKALLLIVQEYFRRYPASPRARIDPNHPEHLWLYAVTAEDARKMAQAYYQFARAQFREAVEGRDKGIRELSAKIAQKEKRILELDQLVETTQKALEELVKTAPYHAEREAQEAVGELDRMLHAAQVELAGIKARIAAIEGYRARPHEIAAQETAKLDMMFIEESIALRGAQAREQMAQRLREQANRFLDLTSTLARATGERSTLPESLEADRRRLAGGQNNLWPTEEEPKVPDKVVIYPVKWVDEPPQN